MMASKRRRPIERPPWRWAALGALCGALLVLALMAPAHWLAAGVAAASHGNVLLQAPQGTVWNGSAQLTLTGGAGSRDRMALPGRVHWRIRPAGTGLDVAVRAACCTPAGPIALYLAPLWGGARVALADGHSVWPAALLTGLGTPWNTIRPEGDVALDTRALDARWTQGRLELAGSAQVTLANMSSSLSPLKPMGSYRIDIRGGTPITLALSTQNGALELTGEGRWVGARLHFTGEARAAPDMEAQLANLLNAIGRRHGNRATISFG